MPTTTGGTIARAAEVGAIVGAQAPVAFTLTGETARRLARYRSPIPLLAFTSAPATFREYGTGWPGGHSGTSCAFGGGTRPGRLRGHGA